jgi:hypothetical protein
MKDYDTPQTEHLWQDGSFVVKVVFRPRLMLIWWQIGAPGKVHCHVFSEQLLYPNARMFLSLRGSNLPPLKRTGLFVMS